MKNKEKALNHIDDFTITVGDVPTVHPYVAKEAIELASEPDWYYPSKGEFSKLNKGDEFLIYPYEIVKFEEDTTFYSEKDDDYYCIKDVIAWTYLPKFEE